MFRFLSWLAEWRDDQGALVEQLADDDTRLALEGELAELGERANEEVVYLRGLPYIAPTNLNDSR